MCLGEAARRLLVRLGDAGGWFFDPSSSGAGSDGGDTNDDEDGRGKASAPPLWREPGSLDAVAVARCDVVVWSRIGSIVSATVVVRG